MPKTVKNFWPQEQTRKGCIFTPGSHFSTNSIKTLASRRHLLQLDLLRFLPPPRVVELQETRYSTVPCCLHDRSAFTRQSYSFVHLLSTPRKGIVNHGAGHPHPSIQLTHPPIPILTSILTPVLSPLFLLPHWPFSAPQPLIKILSDPRFQHYILDY